MSTALQYRDSHILIIMTCARSLALLSQFKSLKSFNIFSTGDTCLDTVPVTTASVTSAITDSNPPTPDGTDTTVNQTPNTDFSTSNPDSSQNDATMKGEFLNNTTMSFHTLLIKVVYSLVF